MCPKNITLERTAHGIKYQIDHCALRNSPEKPDNGKALFFTHLLPTCFYSLSLVNVSYSYGKSEMIAPFS